MRTAAHALWALVGLLVGASLANDGTVVFGAIMGGLAGVAIAELALLWRRVRALESELQHLRSEGAVRPAAVAPVATSTAATSTVVPVVAAEAVAPAVPVPPSRSAWSAAAMADGPAVAPEPVHADGSGEARELPVVRAIRQFFTGGNTLVRAGIVVLFFGVAFLLRYLAEHTHVPVEFRLSGIAVAAVCLLFIGWRLRLRRSGYALALQGGAVGILYLTVFAALRLYALFSPATAFPLLVLLAALSATLAVLQGSQSFALLAVTGGFLAPILASSGQGSHVVLFSYYAILNGAILGTAWFKAWRPLNLAGFLFTFAIATAWGVLRYKPEYFGSTEPFLVLYFLFYVAIAILFTLRQAPELTGYVDGTLVFGTPLAAFALQSALLRENQMALAYSALLVSALYLGLAWLLHRRRSDTQRLLIEAFLALGVVFLTLAIPLALEGRWSAASWALEGAGVLWIGCRQGRRLARGFGAALQLAAGVMILWHADSAPGELLLPASLQWSALLVSVASIFAACVLHARREALRDYERPYSGLLFCWGLLWWSLCGVSAIQQRVVETVVPAAELGFAAITALLCSELCRRAAWTLARVPALLLLPVMVLFALAAAGVAHHPLDDGGWWAWPFAFAAFYVVARRHEGDAAGGLAVALHTLSIWLLSALLSWELAWQVESAVGTRGSWSGIAWVLVPAALLAALPWLTRTVAWPFVQHRRAYRVVSGTGFAAYLAVWMLAANLLMRGDAAPLPDVPLLNPLDLALGLSLLVLIRHYRLLCLEPVAQATRRPQLWIGLLAALGFISLNGALLRALHHWAGVPFSLPALWASTLVQSALSIFWAVLALVTMMIATRRTNRSMWLSGAGLLGVVVAKLFLVDLSSIGSIERIVSFVGVGLLMLVLGYFSPLPPVAEAR